MTRDFDKHEREDERPSSRNTSSGRNGEERSPRPARPRLNRETVDRAWESGAPPKHADYRARNNSRPASRDNWRRDQSAGSSSAQYSRTNRKPFDRDNRQQSERPPYGNADSRPRPYNGGARNFNDQRNNDRPNYTERPPRNNSSEQGAPRNYAPRPYNGDRPQGQRGGYQPRPYNGNRPQGQRGGYQPRPHEGDRPQGQRGGYQPRSFNRDEQRPAHNFERDERPPRNFERNQQGPREYQQRPPQNARWRSRPSMQPDYAPHRYDAPKPAPQSERFEGDYEQFNTQEAPQHSSDQFRDRPDRQPNRERTEERAEQPVERHVTRLPDGRVLKGSRPVQRKNAQFWTEVAHETEALITPVETPIDPEVTNTPRTELEIPPTTQSGEAPPLTKVQRKAQAKPRTASAVVRGKKVGTKKAATKAEKPRSTGPKPSQRGHKWPTT